MKQNLRFELVLSWLAVLEISEIKLKYATVEGSFFNVFTGKTNERINFMYIAASKLKSCITKR